jgi:hypothetical protein
LSLYSLAALRGCYSPKLAVTVFLQIFLDDTLYRALADRVIGLLALFKKSRPEARAATALTSVTPAY